MVLKFPHIYETFYNACIKSIPKQMVGTDLCIERKELKEWAIDLLKDDNAENFLQEDDHVFMMHQGYMFWYFKADGSENPDVYYYHEGDIKPKKMAPLDYFLRNYPQL